MKLQTKKHTLRGILLCVGVIIIALSLFYLYNYLDNNHNNNYNINEGFASYNGGEEIYQPNYSGDPLGTPTIIVNKFIFPLFPSLVSSKYVKPNPNYSPDKIFSNITSNSKTIYALDNSFQIYYYDNSSNTWKQPLNVSLSKPTPTNPSYADYTVASCRPSTGIILNASDTTLWYYNHELNDINHVGCIYYMNLNSNGTIPDNTVFTCLPLVPLRNIVPTHAGETKPSITFDNITSIVANKTILFATGCTALNNTYNLYYLELDKGIPYSGEPVWRSSITKKISKLSINDYCLFIYYSDGNQIDYIPITYDSNDNFSGQLKTWNKTSDPNSPLFNNTPNSTNINPNGFSYFTANNDVCWAINSESTKLWWCALKNGIPISSMVWNSYNCIDSSNRSLISEVIDITLYNNMLIIFTSTNKPNNANNYIINLYKSIPGSTSYTTVANPTGTGATVANPTGTGTTVANPTGTGATVANPTGTGATVANPTGTSATVANPTGTSATVANPSSSYITVPITTSPTTTTQRSTHRRTHTTAQSTTPQVTQQYDPVKALLSGIDLSNFFGNSSGKHNGNSNLYISPMNNSNLYNPTNSNGISRVESLFFPIVKIN